MATQMRRVSETRVKLQESSDLRLDLMANRATRNFVVFRSSIQIAAHSEHQYT